MSPNDSLAYLTSVRYSEEDRRIACEFENGSEKTVLRYPFFPALLTNGTESDVLALLDSVERKQLWFEPSDRVTKIVSPSFSLLSKTKRLIESRLNRQAILPGPKTQFLIQKKWGFFDSFSFSTGSPVRQSRLSLPFVGFGFLSNNLHLELRSLLSEDIDAARSLSQWIVYSNLLKVPPEEVPKTDFEKEELFLENLFFEHALVPSGQQVSAIKPGPVRKLPLHVFSNTTEFDFSSSLAKLSTKPFYNLGFETLDCDCCRPLHASAKNLLPHSIVSVRILSDGFFFDSVFPFFSQSFHESHSEKSSRIQRQNDFGLNQVPIGPLFSGDVVHVPLFDALNLESASDGLIIGLSAPHWFCQKRESFFSETLQSFSCRAEALKESLSKTESKAWSSHQLAAVNFLNQSVSYFFEKAALDLLGLFSTRLVLHAADSASRFFSRDLGRSLEACQLVCVQKFLDFSSKSGRKCLSAAGNNRVFVQDSSGFGLASDFALEQQIPAPIVADWHFAGFEGFGFKSFA